MRLTTYLGLIGGGTVVQATVLSQVQVGGVTPDLPLVLTALVALFRGSEVGSLVGFSLGLFQDLTGGGLVGVQALSKAVVGFGLGFAGDRLMVSNPLIQVSSLIVVSLGEGVIRFVVLKLFHYPEGLGGLMVHVVAPRAVFNGLVGSLCFLGLQWWQARRQA